MFLNFGASLHGHEFSGRSNSDNNKITMSKRSSLRSSIIRNTSRSQRNVSNLRPATSGTMSPWHLMEQTSRTTDPVLQTRELVVQDPPDYDTMSEGEELIVNPEVSKDQNNKGSIRRRKSGPRSSTTFHLAHPAPTLTQTQKIIQIRPKLLLQLQLLTTHSRPKPSIDVLPSSILIPRLARKFPRLLRSKRELGSNDVIIVKSEDYDNTTDCNTENSDTDEHCIANRDLIAVICQIPRAKGASIGVSEIVFSDGSTCLASPLPGGLYEIRIKEEDGREMIAHWWIKRYPKRENIQGLSYEDINTDLKYAFSILDSDSKRQPTLATITHKNLRIFDSHTTFSYSSSSSSKRCSLMSTAKDSSRDSGDVKRTISPNCTTLQIDQKLQTLIQVTGIWVSLRQNWSPYFKYNDALAIACSSTHTNPGSRVRSSSLTIETRLPRSIAYPPNSPDISHDSSVESSMGNKINRISVTDRSTSRQQFRIESQVQPKRAVSAGKAFMQRTAARRATLCASNEISSGGNFKNQKISSKHVVTDRSGVNTPVPSPSSLYGVSLSGSPMNVADAAVTTHRSSLSAYYSPSSDCNEIKDISPPRKSNEITGDFNHPLDAKSRNVRWKSITGFFRRLTLTNPHLEQTR